VPEQGRGVMGHNLVDAEDQNAKSRLGLCMSLGGTSGGVELKHQWRYKKGRWNTLRHKIVLYLSIYLFIFGALHFRLVLTSNDMCNSGGPH
jgi:hypothetical protein